jgi:hypothetical protein
MKNINNLKNCDPAYSINYLVGVVTIETRTRQLLPKTTLENGGVNLSVH